MALPVGNKPYEIMTDPLTVQLWYVCAGPLATLPEKHELVYYFPEGHLEHLQALIDPVPEQNLPPFNLPSKILCKVDDISLMVNPETDEVFSIIKLTPTADVKTLTPLSEPKEKCKFVSFCKALTVSDVKNLGIFTVPRKLADCLPVLDMSKEKPSQDLVAVDLHNTKWRFRHMYRGIPKRHILNCGWGELVSSKKLKDGDAIIFLREENGDLRVGVRRVKSHQFFNTPLEIVSPEGMHAGVLVTAAHSLMNKSSFSVFYRPRGMRPNFVVSMEKYLEAKNWNIDVGRRFTMEFEGNDGLEERFSGTVVGVGANESRRWRNSEWKSLKVLWDKDFPFLPERVSPWEIAPSQSQPQASQSNKRPRASAPSDEPLFSPPAKTTSHGYGGMDSFMGGQSVFSLRPNHDDDGGGPSQHSSTGKKPAYGNSLRLFGCEIVEESVKKPDEEEKSE